MKKRKNAPWTEDDNRRLKQAVENGVSTARAAVMFKRTIDAVRDQAYRIGKPFPTIRDARRVRNAKMEAAKPTS